MNAVLGIRRDAGLTQDQLATRSDVSQPNIAAYESGRRRPTEAMVDRLVRAATALPHQVVDAHRTEILDLATRHHLADLRLFGSTSRRVTHRAATSICS